MKVLLKVCLLSWILPYANYLHHYRHAHFYQRMGFAMVCILSSLHLFLVDFGGWLSILKIRNYSRALFILSVIHIWIIILLGSLIVLVMIHNVQISYLITFYKKKYIFWHIVRNISKNFLAVFFFQAIYILQHQFNFHILSYFILG